MMLKAVGVFVAMIVVDIAWAKYIQTVGERRAVAAASWAAFLYVLGAVVITQYTHDWRLMIPAALGSFVGTYYGARRK
jgi:uncharacterized membrane protein YfcA